MIKEPERFRDVWQAVVDGIARNGRSPTINELCEITGLRSTGAVAYQLGKLVRDRFLEEVPSHHGNRVAGYTIPSAVHIVNGRMALENLFSLLCDSPYLEQEDINYMVNPDGTINYAQVLNFAWVAIREGTEGYCG